MDVELLKKLVTTPGISGREDRIREVVREEVAGLVDEVRTDPLGNLIGVRRGSGPRVMLAAHMDSIGFLVSQIDDKGFLKLSRVGGFDPRTLVMQRVLVQGRQEYVGLLCPAAKPLHLSKPEDRDKAVKLEDLYVDLMLPADEVKANVSIGDSVTLYREPLVNDTSFASHYLDDRLSVYVMLQALREVRETQAELYAVVTVQEEVGLRGARTSAFGVEPQVGVALDVSVAADVPGGGDAADTVKLGAGACISIMDADSISDARLVRRFRELAEQHGIKHQLEVSNAGGTDAGEIQLARAGAPVITMGPPVRYIHTVNELARIEDVDAAVSLLSRFLETAHELDLQW